MTWRELISQVARSRITNPRLTVALPGMKRRDGFYYPTYDSTSAYNIIILHGPLYTK